MELKDSKTWENLQAALAGESQAYTKYQWFAKIAKNAGYNQICNIFMETSWNENAHAKLWWKYLNNDGNVSVMDALKMAWEGENFEYTDMYKDFAETAEKEGFTEIAKKMKMVGEIESHHRDRYGDMMNLIENDLCFSKPEEVTWICLNCGYMTKAKTAPKICPVCKHPQGWFEVCVDYTQNLAHPAV